MEFPEELRYINDHLWVRNIDSGVVIGVTHYLAEQLQEMTFAQLPTVGTCVHAHDELGVLESVKATIEFYAPISGEIIAVNEDLDDAPGLINSDPYGDGWLCKLTVDDPNEIEDLLDASDYQELLDSEEH